MLTTTRALQAYQILRQGAVIATSILLAKSGLPLAEIGTFEQLLFLGTTCTFFWINGLLQSLLPLYPSLPENEGKSLVFNAFALFNILAAGLFLLLLIGEKWWSIAFTGHAGLPHFVLFCSYLALNIPAWPVEHFYLLKNRAASILVWGLVSFGLQIVAVIAPIWLGGGLRESLLALVFLAAARWLWAARLTVQMGKIGWRNDLIFNYLRLAAPLMANSIVGNLIVVFDGWLVGFWFQNEATFAIFRYGSREFPLALALSTGLATAMIPSLATNLTNSLGELKTRSLRLFHAVFPAVIVLLLFSKWLFPLVFRAEFIQSAPIFNIYLLLTASRVVQTGAVMLALKETRAIFWISILEAVVKIGLGFWFISSWGIAGLAFSTVLCFALEKVAQALFLSRKHGIQLTEMMDVRWFVFYVSLMGVAFYMSLNV